MEWDKVDLSDIISFALDFKKLQRVLQAVMSGMEDMRLEITNIHQQQEKWEDTLLMKVNALERQVCSKFI